jgi:hypothetical protein
MLIKGRTPSNIQANTTAKPFSAASGANRANLKRCNRESETRRRVSVVGAVLRGELLSATWCIADLSWMSLDFRVVPSSDLVSVDSASVNGLADTEGDQDQRSCHQHPTGMEAARPPKVTESAKQVEAADEYAGREPRVRL